MATARVYAVELDRDEKEVAALGGVLTADELLRAGRMRAEEQRRRAIVTRAVLRKLLARETGRTSPATGSRRRRSSRRRAAASSRCGRSRCSSTARAARG